MLISEIYCSRQGEGVLTGTPSVFVRTSGCNLRCEFCDTPFASWEPEGRQLSVEQIVHEVDAAVANSEFENAKHVVLTGGEPMLPNDVEVLCESLAGHGFHITIETAGTVYRKLACDLISVSPKFSNSDPSESRAGKWRERHQATRHRPQIVKQLIDEYPFQLKFVIDQEADIEEVERYLENFPDIESDRVLLMPQGVEQAVLEAKTDWLEPACDEKGFTFCPRLHIQWYGNKRGT